MVLPTANTAAMNLFLEHLSQTLADYFIVMQVDQAGWHRSRELIIPSNIRLIQQPAYSPEVNPLSICGKNCARSIFTTASIPRLIF